MALNINIDVSDPSGLLNSNRIQVAANRSAQQEKEDRRAIAKKATPLREENLEEQSSPYSSKKRLETKAPSAKIEEPTAFLSNGYKVASFSYELDWGGISYPGPSQKNPQWKISITPGKSNEVHTFDLFPGREGFEPIDNTRREKTATTVIDYYDEVYADTLVEYTTLLLPAGGENAIFTLYINRYDYAIKKKYTVQRIFNGTWTYWVDERVDPEPSPRPNSFERFGTNGSIGQQVDHSIIDADLGVLEKPFVEEYRTFLVGPKNVKEINTPQEVILAIDPFIENAITHTLTPGSITSGLPAAIDSEHIPEGMLNEDGTDPYPLIRPPNGNVFYRFGKSFWNEPEIVNVNGAEYMNSQGEILYYDPWQIYEPQPFEEISIGGWKYFQDGDLFSYIYQSAQWWKRTSYWFDYDIDLGVLSYDSTKTVIPFYERNEFINLGSASYLDIITPGIFFVLQNPNTEWNDETAQELANTYFPGDPIPNISITTTYMQNSKIRFDYVRGLYYSWAGNNVKIIKNPKAVYEDRGGSVYLWDWGKPAYCRQKLFDLGFTSQDLAL